MQHLRGVVLLLVALAFGQLVSGQVTTQVTCQSWNFQYTECDVYTATGPLVCGSITVVQQLSNTNCDSSNFGVLPAAKKVWVAAGCRAVFQVSYNPGGSNLAQVTCQSQSYRYAECDVPGASGRLVCNSMILLTQLSNTQCTSSNFGVAPGATKVYVNSGCRGVFQVAYDTAPIATTLVTCQSNSYRYAECSVPGAVGPLICGSMRLVQQLSRTDCIPGRFGEQSGTKRVWVNNGCRGVFEVAYYTNAC